MTLPRQPWRCVSAPQQYPGFRLLNFAVGYLYYHDPTDLRSTFHDFNLGVDAVNMAQPQDEELRTLRELIDRIPTPHPAYSPPGSVLAASRSVSPRSGPSTNNRACFRGPITLANILPDTVYKDKKSWTLKNGTVEENSTKYLAVQRDILKWLDTHATDQLAVTQARRWTEKIDRSAYPRWQDAARLCHYMRSIKFDTYTHINPKTHDIKLYIANPNSNSHGPQVDPCYWIQNMGTQEIKEVSARERGELSITPSEATGNIDPPHRTRRNAIPNPEVDSQAARTFFLELAGEHSPPQ